MLLNRHVDNFGAFGNYLLNECSLKVVLTTVKGEIRVSAVVNLLQLKVVVALLPGNREASCNEV